MAFMLFMFNLVVVFFNFYDQFFFCYQTIFYFYDEHVVLLKVNQLDFDQEFFHLTEQVKYVIMNFFYAFVI